MNKSYCRQTHSVSVCAFFLEPGLTFCFHSSGADGILQNASFRVRREKPQQHKLHQGSHGQNRRENLFGLSAKLTKHMFLGFVFCFCAPPLHLLHVTVSRACDKTYKGGRHRRTQIRLHKTPPSSCASARDPPEDETCDSSPVSHL